MLLADVQRRVLVVKPAVDTMAEFVRQLDRLVRFGADLGWVQSDGASAAARNRESLSRLHWDIVHVNVVPPRV